jgi:protein O-GlcNAc transferase
VTSPAALQKKMDRAMQYHRAKDLVRAEALYREVLAKDARHLVATHLLGALLLETQRNENALDLLRKAVQRAPNEAVFFVNLGEAQRRLGQYANAKTSFHWALRLRPGLAEAHHALGLIFRSEGREEDAIIHLRQAIVLKPGNLRAHLALAGALYRLERLDEAYAVCSTTLELDSNSADVHDSLGVVLTAHGRMEEAIASYRRALDCEPGHQAAHSNLVFALPFHLGETCESIKSEAIQWGQRHAATMAKLRRPHANERDPARRLRVGYVSPDFRRHCQALFFLPLIEHHNRAEVDVFCYSLVIRPDEVTENIRGLAYDFRNIAEVGDAEVLETIRKDRIDLLIDLTMHMSGNRLGLFAAKPAPVQVAWLAYPGTTGLEAMDYRITDVFLDPPELQSPGAYSEKSVRLPETFWCYAPMASEPMASEPEIHDLPASSTQFVTFGSFNNFAKTNAAVFALWSRVLHAVDRSRLLLLAQSDQARARTLDAFCDAGIDPKRLEFTKYLPRPEYLAQYGKVDIVLDTFPYNGHTTSLDAFWMGVPVVTLLGSTVVGRAGLCYAKNLGLDGLVARTPDEFVAIACDLAGDLPRLARLRADLRERMQRSPLMDAPRFARHIEAAYRWMWRQWCETSIGEP